MLRPWHQVPTLIGCYVVKERVLQTNTGTVLLYGLRRACYTTLVPLRAEPNRLVRFAAAEKRDYEGVFLPCQAAGLAEKSFPISCCQVVVADSSFPTPHCRPVPSRGIALCYAADTAGCQLRIRLNVTPPQTADWLKTASAAAPTPGTAPALPYRYTADCV